MVATANKGGMAVTKAITRGITTTSTIMGITTGMPGGIMATPHMLAITRHLPDITRRLLVLVLATPTMAQLSTTVLIPMADFRSVMRTAKTKYDSLADRFGDLSVERQAVFLCSAAWRSNSLARKRPV
jgi:hypothetical protein